jgi:hypothetical protein
MPYIKQEGRERLDHLIDLIAKTITYHDGPDLKDMAGALNYVAYRLALKLMGTPSYWKVALIDGVFSNISKEFYRRVAVPYEETKIKENGDVNV